MKLAERQNIEINFWRDSETEAPGSDSIENILNKVSDAAVFVDVLKRYAARLPAAGRVLEIGGGQGWAACVYKKFFPAASVLTSDISEFAVASVHKWEKFYGVALENSYACLSYQIPEPDSSLDLVFCYAAAHHFAAHRRTLKEISRVLKPGGSAFYFYEPTSPEYCYRLARWRVNHVRPEVPEDVLRIRKIRSLGREAGLESRVEYFPSLIKRGPMEMVYYLILSRLPFLQRVVPCTANFSFYKRAGA